MNREPAVLWTALIVPVVHALTALAVTNDPGIAGAINAAAVAAAGAITAVMVRSDKQLPALTGLAQAVLALIVAFGVQLTPEQQAAVLAPIAIVAGYVVRDRVTAPAPAGPRAA